MPYSNSPTSGRFSLREYRARSGGSCWRLLFQPNGVNIKPDDITVMTMQAGEVLPVGKRLQLSEKLLQVGLPFAWEFSDVACAAAAYRQIYQWHEAAACVGLIAKSAEDAAQS